MPKSSPPPPVKKRNLLLDGVLLLSIAILSVIEFRPFLTSGSFSSEFTQFFMFTHGASLTHLLGVYLSFVGFWYRPTQFLIPYWLGEKFISWHNPDAWRAYELFTMLIVCALIYWLVLVLLPGRRIAAFSAAFYFTCVPVVFIPLYELFAFDFLHVIFCLLSAIAFIIGYRLRTWRGVGWTVLAWLAYVGALTSKEVTVVAPLYLTIVSAIFYFYEPGPGEKKQRILREVYRVVPFWMMTAAYWWLHVRNIPPAAFSGSTDYRLGADWILIVRNLNKYPLWFARIYSYTLDLTRQADAYQNLRNDVIGIVLLLLVCYACFRLWRTGPEYQKYVLLAVAWVAVFLMVPVYSGGYLWHGNAALCGYCLLFGVMIDWLIHRVDARWARVAFGAVLIAGAVGVTRADAAECLISGIHSETYRINSTVLTQPPVPLNRVPAAALVYVEDRRGIGTWYFGAGSLFNVVYLDRKLRQVTVPVMSKVSRRDCLEWLKNPNAFFFQYDDNYRWHDATDQFRAYAMAKSSEQVFPPEITSLYPAETRAGVDFNQQKSGLSAMGVTGLHFEQGAEVLINGQKQPTAFAGTWVSTTVPREAYARPGKVVVQVRNPDGLDSEPFLFPVK